MTDVAHGVYLLVNGRLFLCGAERAIAPTVPQCARAGFDLRTCKTAMSQMRDSLSAVVKARLKARIRAFSTPRYHRPTLCEAKLAKEPVLPKDIAALSFEDALKELETIVQQLERGQVKLDEAITAYERGALLKRHCEQKLAEAKMKVEKIVFSADGTVGSQSADPS
jgi:exodeoxyribonuclease VII small subunit